MLNLIPVKALLKRFRHPETRQAQQEALAFVAKSGGCAILEMPTGEGKTAVGMALASYVSKDEGKGSVYLAPTKTLIDQVTREYPEAKKMLGRAEYDCLYYTRAEHPEPVTAEDSPCYMLDCKHRVNQKTGETQDPKADPCPYFQAKYEALQSLKKGGIVACTTAFFLKNRLLVPGWQATPADEIREGLDLGVVVIDEVHGIAKVARSIFEYEMTDHHLYRAVDILQSVDEAQAKKLDAFADAFRRITFARKRPAGAEHLLDDDEIERLITRLSDVDPNAVEKAVNQAQASGILDPAKNRSELKLLENLIRGIPGMLRSLRYSVEREETNDAGEIFTRYPLNMVVAFYRTEEEMLEGKMRVQHKLTIKSHHVAGLIRKAVGSRYLGYSATISNVEIFGHDTGLYRNQFPAFLPVGTEFSPDNTRVYLPLDAPDLSISAFRKGKGTGPIMPQQRKDFEKRILVPQLVKIAEAAHAFAEKGKRSLVVVISERERELFVGKAAPKFNLDVVTYGNGVKARAAAAEFKAGKGQVLLGTSAQFSEGIDLPDGCAPVIFFLRPGFPNPESPLAKFEARRFGKQGKRGQMAPWALIYWRLTVEALQVRGRNIRGRNDKGVTFFVSKGFHDFVGVRLPTWLQAAARPNMGWDAAVEDAMKLLSSAS